MARKRETKAEREARHAFYERVLLESGCYFKNIFPHQCDGPRDPCHLLSKQKLKRIAKDRGYDADETIRLVWDPRNGVPGCRAQHHRMDNGFLRVYWEQLPSKTKLFADDWDLEWEILQVYRDKMP